jgi:hypothetical protein
MSVTPFAAQIDARIRKIIFRDLEDPGQFPEEPLDGSHYG